MVPFYRTLRLFKRHKDNPKTCTFQVTCSHTNSAFFPNPSFPISLRLQQFLFFLSSLGVKGFSTKALSSLGFCVYWQYWLRQKLWCSYQDCSPVCLYGYHPLQQPPAQQICVCSYHLLVYKTKIRQTKWKTVLECEESFCLQIFLIWTLTLLSIGHWIGNLLVYSDWCYSYIKDIVCFRFSKWSIISFFVLITVESSSFLPNHMTKLMSPTTLWLSGIEPESYTCFFI